MNHLARTGLFALLLVGMAAPVQATILFQDNFDAQPNWDGNPVPSSVGGNCFNDTCQNLPNGWSFYRTQRCSNGHCSLTIEDGPATPPGNKSLYHWLETGSSWANDGILSWHDKNNNYPEIWVQFDVAWDPNWIWDDASSPQLKMFRISHYLGQGNQGDTWPTASYINDPNSHRPLMYYDWIRPGGGCSTLVSQYSPRCGAHQECAGGPWNNQRFFWNIPGARYCTNNNLPDQQCIPGDPVFGDSRCNDGTCDGPLVKADTNTNPSSYGSSCCQQGYCSGNPDQRADWWTWRSPGHHGDGQWHTMKFRMVMNSSPGARDGIIEIWQDDVKIHRDTDIAWRPSGDSTSGNGWNHVGFGGNNFAVNPNGTQEQWYAFDNVIIATSEGDLSGTPSCQDGNDNDGDGLTDLEDPGCANGNDSSETNPAVACDDGVDNDGDGLLDFRSSGGDPGCSSLTDNDENNCGNGSIEPGEQCEGSNVAGQTCASLGFEDGTVTCDNQCRFDTSACTSDCSEIQSKAGWNVGASSEETDPAFNTPASNAIDENPNTFWLSEWVDGAAGHPIDIGIDLGATREICGISYLPRQSAPFENGVIANYEIAVSTNTQNWTVVDTSATSGPFFTTPYTLTSVPVVRQFAPINARYIRYRSLSDISGGGWAAAAELGVWAPGEGGGGQGDPPGNVSGAARTDVEN